MWGRVAFLCCFMTAIRKCLWVLDKTSNLKMWLLALSNFDKHFSIFFFTFQRINYWSTYRGWLQLRCQDKGTSQNLLIIVTLVVRCCIIRFYSTIVKKMCWNTLKEETAFVPIISSALNISIQVKLNVWGFILFFSSCIEFKNAFIVLAWNREGRQGRQKYNGLGRTDSEEFPIMSEVS